MDTLITVAELRRRRDHVFNATGRAVADHPATYKEIKTIARAIVNQPLDIMEYFPTVEKLVRLLKRMDSGEGGSIFDRFILRISPQSIWQVRHLRVECRDLLAYLHDFDQWRRKICRLRVVK